MLLSKCYIYVRGWL